LRQLQNETASRRRLNRKKTKEEKDKFKVIKERGVNYVRNISGTWHTYTYML